MALGSNNLKPRVGEEKPVPSILKDFGIAGVFRLVATICGIYGDIYLDRFQNTKIGFTIPNNWGSGGWGNPFFTRVSKSSQFCISIYRFPPV
jgi:hypothetical protein